ncbi:insulinase family protein [Thalassotalea ponticola]|uniref:insulinase family protein n=1 Tax=Thalassotalea ponticola TaxID=1523392 RepID=UPI0025B38930|nr:insulinase family protein [Thalassotalea ponticola]MDN3651640.1 insulinase family protein [Thalassotalea ponticola]
MKTSPNDSKQYHPFTLANGLRVMVIHNSESNRCAAALAVNVGHFDDPDDRQGMAHFLEHMLFLGTKKYPDSGEYQQFLAQHSGSNNAWTGTEHTAFFFDINAQYFEQALDRFSRFFSEPLLAQEYIDKERLNIDSEFKLKLKDEMRRIYDVHKETINPAHPFSKFSVGNCDTLADRIDSDLKDEVSDFFTQHYRANRMTLVLEGPQSLDELSALVVEKFSDIAAGNGEKPPITEPLYLPEHLGIHIAIRPLKQERKLILSFALPGIDKDYRFKPASYLAYLLGHEGPGSILSILKDKQWALGLSAGGGINGSNFKDFNISVRLTEAGQEHTDDIIELIFAYIKLIKQDGLIEQYFNEKKAILEFAFQYQEKLKPLDSVNQLVIAMHHYPSDDYMYGDYVMKRFNLPLTQEYLNALTHCNMRVIHINPDVVTDTISHWYQVPYSITPITPKQQQTWQSASIPESLSLPDANPYIVDSPTVIRIEDDMNIPRLISQRPGFKVWFKQDKSFHVPKGQIIIGIDSKEAIKNKQHIAMTRLFVELFSDSVLEQNYDAELAGIHYHLYPHQGGMTLQLSGINEKQPLLLEKLLLALKDHSLAKPRFELFKHQLVTHWRNAEKSKSISQLFSKLNALMKPSSPSGNDLADALEQTSFRDFTEFCALYFNKLTIESFIYGNWNVSHAQSITSLIDNKLGEYVDANAKVICNVVDCHGQGSLLMPQILADHDYASVVYYPMADVDNHTMAMTMLTSHLLSPHFFQRMRTEKQYGYLVGVGYMPMNRFPGIAFYIQSPDTPTEQLFSAIDEFIDGFDNNITAQEWTMLKQGIVGQLQEKDTNGRIKSQRYWMSICNGDINFDQKQRLIESIESLQLDDISAFIQQRLASQASPDRICLASVKHEDELKALHNDNKVIVDIDHFHTQTPFKSAEKLWAED